MYVPTVQTISNLIKSDETTWGGVSKYKLFLYILEKEKKELLTVAHFFL